MPSLHEVSEAAWNGTLSTATPEGHPFVRLNLLEEVAPGIAFYKDFSNQCIVKTADGLVLIDAGSYNPLFHRPAFDKIRTWSADPVKLAIYTHGHVDHAYGLTPFLDEAKRKNWTPPQIAGHENILPRMKRYVDMNGYNSIINSRQFGAPVAFPKQYQAPNLTYSDRMTLRVGDRQFELTHAKGETDDHTWVWLPKERILYTGDLFIWAAPNAGNPQKVQRYVIEWAQALSAMAKRKPVLLLPGHGFPIEGEARVAQALNDTASYLESLHTQTVAMMNQGATVYDIIGQVKPPADLARRPYLLATYDEPEFITRTIWRLYGGWYSGVPSEVKPAPRAEQGRELAQLAGGAGKLVERAEALAAAGNFRMACHLVDWAVDAEPANAEAHRSRAAIYAKRVNAESSTMSKGIFGAAARESAGKVNR